jgi:hypothetical protein
MPPQKGNLSAIELAHAIPLALAILGAASDSIYAPL